MGSRRSWPACAALVAALLLSACGGGGGGGPPAGSTLALQTIQVTTQPNGPQAPFGTTKGGDRAVLTGSGFEDGLTVRFGAAPATVLSVGAAQVEVQTPAGPEGFVDVTVQNPDTEMATLSGVFQYIAPPTILTVRAVDGPTAGEARAPIGGNVNLELDGQKFRAGAQVTVGGLAVATTFVSDTKVTFRLPADPVDSEQVVDVGLANPEGLSAALPRSLVYTQEFSLKPLTSALTQTRATHLYRRAAFGAPPAVIARAVSDGLAATVTRLLDFTNDPQVEQDALTIYGAATYPFTSLTDRTNKEWWIHQLLENPNPLQERLAFFLHDHFATSEAAFDPAARWFLHEQVKLLRRFSVAKTDAIRDGSPGLGYDWKALLVQMGKDRAMLEWLDGRQSRVGAINENYARELWELFMLGEGNGYTEADIKEAARAFTGFEWFRHTDGYLEMRYREARHDAAAKTVLGANGNFGYDSISPFHSTNPALETDPRDSEGIVSVTLRQRPVEASRFLCRRLLSFFLYEDPHDSTVEELALELRTAGPNQWNVKPILSKILRSKAMYSSRAMKGKVKSPVEFVIGFLRTTDVALDPRIANNAARVRERLINTGQVVLDPPDVNGWPSGTSWMASQAQIERFNFLNFAVMQLDDVATQIEPLLPPRGQRSPTQLVDHFSSLLDVQLSGNARTKLVQYVTSQVVGGNVVPFAFDPTNDQHLRMKTRGLLWQLGQYHDAHQD